MLNLNELLENYTKTISDTNRRLAQTLIETKNHQHRYLFGRNDLSSQLSELIEVDGFIDDFVLPGLDWKGKPVLSLRDIDLNSVVINCVNNSRPATAFNRIRDAGVNNILSYSDLCKALQDIIPLPDFVKQTRDDVYLNPEKWQSVYEILFDVESKKVFEDVLRFRLTADSADFSGYTYRPKEQYFEDFLRIGAEVFVDAGGFDGDTTEQFCLRYPDYRKVYLFEPSQENMQLAKQRLNSFRSIEFIEKGVSDTTGVLCFNSNLGSASSISENGEISIEVTSIDSYIKDEVSFIKMDLEGWELKALKGAADQISKYHPKLAIAVYHNASDMWETYQQVMSYWPNYKVYLRHYTEGWTETIMYFVSE